MIAQFMPVLKVDVENIVDFFIERIEGGGIAIEAAIGAAEVEGIIQNIQIRA